MRKTARFALLGCVWGFGFSLPGIAFAAAGVESGTVLKPTSVWSVSRIDPDQEGLSSYCAMVRRFDRDVILTFARNFKGESSLAVDFQKKDALQKGRDYTVDLKAGTVERTYEVSPVSGSAFVLRFGEDEPFRKALEESNALDMVFGGRPVSFDFASKPPKNATLDGCLSSLKGGIDPVAEAASVPEQKAEQGLPKEIIPAAVSAPSDDTILHEAFLQEIEQKYVHQIDSLAQGMEALQAENASLRALAEERGSLEAQQSVGQNVIAEMDEKIRILEQEKSALSQRLQEASVQPKSLVRENVMSSDVAPQLEDLRLQLQERDRVIEDLSRKLQGQAPSASDGQSIKILKDQISVLEKDKVKLVQDLTKTGSELKTLLAKPAPVADSDTAELKGRVSQLEAEKKTLSDTLAQTQAKLQETIAEVSKKRDSEGDVLRSVRADLSAALAERDALKTQVEALMQDLEKEREKDLVSGDVQLLGRYNEAQREIQRLGTLLEKTTQQYEHEKQEIDRILFDPEVAEEKQISRLNTLSRRVEEAESDLKETRQSLEESKTETEARLVPLKKALAEKEARIAEITATTVPIAEIQKIRQEHELQAEELRQKIHALEMSLEEKGKDSERVQDLSFRVETLKQELASSDQALAQEREKVSELQGRVEEAQKHVPLVSRLKQDVASLRAERDALKTALAGVSPSSTSEADIPDFPGLDEQKRQVSRSVPPSPGAVESQPLSSTGPATPPMPTARFLSVGQITKLLRDSGVKPGSAIQASNRTPDYVAYQWDSENLFGSAEQSLLGRLSDFETFVNRYVEKAGERCKGDFASVPSLSYDGNPDLRLSSYEVACVSPSAQSSAALVFLGQAGLFTVIAHESTPETMDAAMDARDRIYNYLAKGGLVASSQR